MKTTVNTRVKQLRIALSMSQTEFAHAINLSHSLLSKIESTDREVSNKLIESISETFKVDAKWLIKGEGEMTFTKPSKLESSLNSNLPWKDEAYANIKEAYSETKRQLNFLQEQYSMLMMMLKDAKTGKFNPFEFTAKPTQQRKLAA